jgi:L-fucose isomerase-like protein
MDKKGSRATAAACYAELYSNGATGTGCPIAVGCFNSVGKSALKGEEHLGWGFMNKGSDWGQSDKDGVTYMLNGHVHEWIRPASRLWGQSDPNRELCFLPR